MTTLSARLAPLARVALALLAGIAAPAWAVPQYRLLDLGPYIADGGGNAINAAGRVAGHYGDRAALFVDGNISIFGTLGGATSVAHGVSDDGPSAGAADLPDGRHHPYSYHDSRMWDLGTLDGDNGEGVAWALASTRLVVGGASTATSYHAFLYDGTQMRDLGTLPGAERSEAYAVNAKGQATGSATFPSGVTHAFAWKGARMTDLGTLGDSAASSVGLGISAKGVVTGWSEHAATDGHPARRTAFLAFQGQLRDLGTLPGATDSIGRGINRKGHVVGDDGAGGNAFLYDGYAMHELSTLTVGRAAAGWMFKSATAINDLGQITGVGVPPGSFTTHAYRLSPIKLPVP